MRNLRTVGIALLAIGVIVLAVALLADPIGIGEGNKFGSNQILAAVVGAIVAIAGLILMRRQ
jgi:hypothetical protein